MGGGGGCGQDVDAVGCEVNKLIAGVAAVPSHQRASAVGSGGSSSFSLMLWNKVVWKALSRRFTAHAHSIANLLGIALGTWDHMHHYRELSPKRPDARLLSFRHGKTIQSAPPRPPNLNLPRWWTRWATRQRPSQQPRWRHARSLHCLERGLCAGRAPRTALSTITG